LKKNKINFLKRTISLSISQRDFKEAESYLLNYNFILQKVIYVDVKDLINDYKNLLNYEISNEQKKEALELLLSVFEQTAHILKDHPKQINSQLIGFLEKGKNLFIDGIIKTINDKTKSVWLQPITPNLVSQQGGLEKIFIDNDAHNITALEISHHKKWIISGTSAGNIKVWDIQSKNNIYSFENEKDDAPITTIKEVNGKYIISLENNSGRITLRLWDLENQTSITRHGKYNEYRKQNPKLEVVDDGKYVITEGLSDEKTLVVWKLPTLEAWQVLKHKDTVEIFEVYTTQKKKRKHLFDKSLIEQNEFKIVTNSPISAEKNRITVYVLKRKKFRVIKTFFVSETGNLNSLIIRKKSNSLILSGLRNRIKVYNLSNGKCLHNFKVIDDEKTLLNGVFLTQSENAIITFSNKCSLWSLEKEKLIRDIEGSDGNIHQKGIIIKGVYAFSNNQKDGSFDIWDLKNATIKHKIKIDYSPVQTFKAIDDKFIISNSSNRIHLWNIQRNIIRKKTNHFKKINSIKIYNDGKKAITASSDESFKILDVINNTCDFTSKGNNNAVEAIEIIKKGDNYFALVSDMIDGNRVLRVWDVSKKEHLYMLKGHHLGDMFKIQVIKNGNIAISSAGDQTVKLWNLNAKDCEFTFYINNHNKKNEWGYFSTFQVYNHERNLITASGNGTLRIWDLQYKRLVKELEGHTDAIYALEISSNGKFALTSSQDGSIKLWDLKKFESKTIIEDPEQEFYLTFFLPYSYNSNSKNTEKINNSITDDNLETHILSSSLKNNNIKLWDINLRECVKIFSGHSDKIGFLFILETSPKLVSITYSGEIMLWDTYTGKRIASLYLSRKVTAASITPNEKTLLIGEYNGQIHFIRIKEERSTSLKVVHRS